jgi:diguanylate cyclase (GGDEF)-like protein
MVTVRLLAFMCAVGATSVVIATLLSSLSWSSRADAGSRGGGTRDRRARRSPPGSGHVQGARGAFDDALAMATANAERQGASAAVLLLDADGFKTINDRFGHQAGDSVLARLGATLARTVRGGDVAARFGGDEFALLLPSGTAAEARQLALRLHRAIEAEFGADPVPLTVSIGTASFPADGTTVERVLRVADERLYQAKSGDVAGGESPADRSLLFGYSAGPKLTVASRAL